jgi:chromosome segregation ATPase
MIGFRSDRAARVIAFAVLVCVASAQAAEMPVEDGLTQLGLKRVGSIYVLGAESDVQRKLSEAKSMAKQLDNLMQQTAAFDPKVHHEMIQNLNDRLEDLSVEIKATNRQLSKMPRNRWGYPLDNRIAAQIEALTIYREQLEHEFDQKNRFRNSLRNRPPNPQLSKKIDDELKVRRDKYSETVHELKQLVDSTSKQYDELAKNPEVTKAIANLGRSMRPKPKLGPTSGFVANRKLVDRLDATTLK